MLCTRATVHMGRMGMQAHICFERSRAALSTKTELKTEVSVDDSPTFLHLLASNTGPYLLLWQSLYIGFPDLLEIL